MSDKERSCCFFGQVITSNRLKTELRKAVRSAVADGYRDFYVGKHVGFERQAFSVLMDAKADYPDISINLISSVLPEAKTETGANASDSTALGIKELYLGEAGLSFRDRIKVSAQKIAARCGLAICYVEEDRHDLFADVVRYFRSVGVTVINLMDSFSYFDI